MGEMEESITIRMGKEDTQTMDDFMVEIGVKSRSRFIRDAIIGYINLKKEGANGAGNGIFVRFKEVQMEAIRLMVEQGVAFDEEEFVRKCTMDRIVTKESEVEAANRALAMAQKTSAMK
ncbi:hypothetical protein Mpt1_c05260 [Candidatus Methanoplasma termitum]|uniref:Ribbon-helix-helix protein CopG domain-containing protein n=1 Tax=Candidatus Methanoplasma termitum TaxID=1577791 RepID=A0A0A7LFY5_9ARCH|nr:hypothetical protein [Candidatus Methanoplasma termitum]AIZ56416.1 hypothetical protein Mpt1_c05260 [Candidatus Methanoplasma termitum]MCL2333731.1 ribbon-helix-helix domain-containing protein [Candidatus Methanoplasma sp.]